MTTVAIIGGTGLTRLADLIVVKSDRLETPYGTPSADFIAGEFHGRQVIFLARHGNPHTIVPHKVNYRANIWGLKQLGVEKIVAVAAVGGITPGMNPAHLVIPDQIIDYTYGRAHTFFDDGQHPVTHIDFTHPYHSGLREDLLAAAERANLSVLSSATYGCTQGPRLESAAEIRRLERDGCDLVGMTGMPEAALARELGIAYAAIAVVANWAAGKSGNMITMAEIEQHLSAGMIKMSTLLKAFLTLES